MATAQAARVENNVRMALQACRNPQPASY
jgi:hypothetical protein